MTGKPTNVQFVDERFLERDQRRRIVPPVVTRAPKINAAARGAMAVEFTGCSPDRTIRHQRRGRVEQHLRAIVAMTDARWSVDAPAIAEAVLWQTHDLDVPVISGAVELAIESDLGDGLVVAVHGLNDKRDGSAMPAQQREVQSIVRGGSAERQGPAASGAKSRGDCWCGHWAGNSG